VLNTQRQRIYAQRDAIFNKPDLREDVTEMLRTELGTRVQNGMEDPEGPWKLLAYLEEIQPTIDTPWASYPSFPFRLALEQLGEPADEDELAAKLLEMARQAIEAEDVHLLESVHTLLDKTEQSLKAQLAERSDTLDAYLESFDPQDKHDLQGELSALLQASVRIAPSQQKALLADPRGQKPWLQDALRTNLTQLQVRRLLLTLERRMGESWQLKAADLASQPWKEIRAQVLAQIEGTMERRKQRLAWAGGRDRARPGW